jgi:hypothetical protein
MFKEDSKAPECIAQSSIRNTGMRVYKNSHRNNSLVMTARSSVCRGYLVGNQTKGGDCIWECESMDSVLRRCAVEK